MRKRSTKEILELSSLQVRSFSENIEDEQIKQQEVINKQNQVKAQREKDEKEKGSLTQRKIDKLEAETSLTKTKDAAAKAKIKSQQEAELRKKRSGVRYQHTVPLNCQNLLFVHLISEEFQFLIYQF